MVVNLLIWTKSLGIGGNAIFFSVREAYKVLQPRVSSIFVVEGIWVPCAPIKTTFFCLGSSLG